MPHVTVGLYADACPPPRSRPASAAAPQLHTTVERICLMRYAAAEIGGALSTLAEWDLAAHRCTPAGRFVIGRSSPPARWIEPRAAATSTTRRSP